MLVEPSGLSHIVPPCQAQQIGSLMGWQDLSQPMNGKSSLELSEVGKGLNGRVPPLQLQQKILHFPFPQHDVTPLLPQHARVSWNVLKVSKAMSSKRILRYLRERQSRVLQRAKRLLSVELLMDVNRHFGSLYIEFKGLNVRMIGGESEIKRAKHSELMEI